MGAKRTKIGRNQQCPCGSGKKHKKCCLLADSHASGGSMNHRTGLSFSHWAQAQSPGTLISRLAGLMTIPANQARTLRLECAIHLSCLSYWRCSPGTGDPSSSELRRYLAASTDLQTAIQNEDPPEQPFLATIPFVGGNYRAYVANVEDGSFSASHLLRAVLLESDAELPSRFVDAVYASCHALLILAEEVVRRSERCNSVRLVDAAQDVVIPNNAQLDCLSSSVVFTKDELESLLQAADLPEACLDPFFARPTQAGMVEADFDRNPLLNHPLIKIGTNLIFALPSATLTAISSFCLRQASRFGVIATLANRYQARVYAEVLRQLDRIGMTARPFPPACESSGSEMAGFSDALLQVDVDKIVYMQLVGDDLDGVTEPWVLAPRPHTSKPMAYCSARTKSVCEALGSDWLVLVLLVVNSVGRPTGLDISAAPEGVMGPFVLTAGDLCVLAGMPNFTGLSLWRFQEGYEKFCAGGSTIVSTSTLDVFAFYQDHRCSFYSTDEPAPHLLHVGVGVGRSLRMIAAQRWSPRAIPSWESNGLIEVVPRYERDVPISVPAENLGQGVLHAVEGFGSPIWVRGDGVESRLRAFCNQLVDALSYWLWQAQSVVTSEIFSISEPITVCFELENPDFWHGKVVRNAEGSNASVKVSVSRSRRLVSCLLADDFAEQLARPDNEAERDLVRRVLDAMLSLAGGNSNKADGARPGDQARSLVDRFAPVGHKKMIVSTDALREPALDPRGVPPYAPLHSHDVEAELDGLCADVESRVSFDLVEGAIPRDRYRDVMGAIVGRYLDRLRTLVGKFEAISVTRALVARNEASVYADARRRLTAATSVACFENAEAKASLLAEELPEAARAALATRFAIEFVVAEHPSGDGVVSDRDLDRVVAVAHGMANWGALGDQIRCRVFDHELFKLPSGRVGVGRPRVDALGAFLSAKSVEDLDNAVRASEEDLEGFTASLKPTESDLEGSLGSLDEAMRAEIGLGVEEVVRFAVATAQVGLGSGESAPILKITEFVSAVASAGELNVGIVEHAVDEFSSVRRSRWDVVPDLFCELDILPQRFGRGLSLMRRPLIRLAEGASEYIIWGPRHTHAALRQLIAVYSTGAVKDHQIRSSKMRALRGAIIDRRGSRFEKHVVQWAHENTRFLVFERLEIGPGKRFEAPKDLGDLDCVLACTRNFAIYCVEAKAVDSARNSVEMSQEMDRLIRGDSRKPNAPSRVEMQMRRARWVSENLAAVVRDLAIPVGPWKVVPIMLVSTEIPAPYLIESPCPFVSMSVFQRDVEGTLQRLLNGRLTASAPS